MTLLTVVCYSKRQNTLLDLKPQALTVVPNAQNKQTNKQVVTS